MLAFYAIYAQKSSCVIRITYFPRSIYSNYSTFWNVRFPPPFSTSFWNVRLADMWNAFETLRNQKDPHSGTVFLQCRGVGLNGFRACFIQSMPLYTFSINCVSIIVHNFSINLHACRLLLQFFIISSLICVLSCWLISRSNTINSAISGMIDM